MKTIEKLDTLQNADRALLDDVKSAILRHQPLAKVLLYGSAARGERKPDSDYDVLAIVPHALSTAEEDAAWDDIFDLQLKHGALISVHFCPVERWERHPDMPFHANVAREGILL